MFLFTRSLISARVFLIIAIYAVLPIEAQTETSLRSQGAKEVTLLIWGQEFSSAIERCHQLIADEPENPVGHFLMGLTYYAINNQFRNDFYADSVIENLNAAISCAEIKIKEEKGNPDWYFVLGSAYGCRALYRSIHGGWWGAFRDGHHSCSNLEKAFKLDSTLTDALSGMGAYHYWKSAKTKVLTVLPFVGNKRKQGISEILEAVNANGIMSQSARKSLLPIYFNEKNHEQVLALADSLDAMNILDLSSSLHLARALIELGRWSDAEQALGEVEAAWSSSIYNDPCGATEVLYLRARILRAQGDIIGVKECLKRLSAMEDSCAANAYFRQTLSNARELSP